MRISRRIFRAASTLARADDRALIALQGPAAEAVLGRARAGRRRMAFMARDR